MVSIKFRKIIFLMSRQQNLPFHMITCQKADIDTQTIEIAR